MQNNKLAVVLFLVLQIQDSISFSIPFLDCKRLCWTDVGFPGLPVCGSDGITYQNSCSLKIAKCEGRPDLTVAYEGKCKTKG